VKVGYSGIAFTPLKQPAIPVFLKLPVFTRQPLIFCLDLFLFRPAHALNASSHPKTKTRGNP
jgi:hypothetical protein